MRPEVHSAVVLAAFLALVPGPIESQQVDRSSSGMVVTQHRLATEAGVEMLEAGGNAVDAAVAAGFAIGVVDLANAGIGGRAQILLRTSDGRFFGIDGTTQVPAGYDPDSSDPRPEAEIESRTGRMMGYDMVGIPGTVAALTHLLEEHGSMPLSRVMAPAIRFAEEGVTVEAGMLPPRRPRPAFQGFLELPGAPSKLWKEDGSPYAPGDLFVQPNLARTLRAIADGGAEAFYRGEIARRIAEDMEAHGGSLRYEDLADYRIRPSRLVGGTYRGHDIVGTDYPAAGGVTIAALQTLERLSPPADDDVRWAADVVRALQAANHDGVVAVRSPDLGPSWLTSDSLADRRAAEIQALPALAPLPETGGGSDSGHTTHLTVVDREGAVVALTQSLGNSWGAMVVTEDLGFPYAMTMGYLRHTPPGARPGSYQSPTIVLEEGKVVYALGAAGAFRIIASIVESLSRAIDLGQPFSLAVASRRLAPTGSSSMIMEDHPDARWSDEQMARLREAGWSVDPAESGLGILHGIAWDEEAKAWIGVADPRGPGTARGPRDPSRVQAPPAERPPVIDMHVHAGHSTSSRTWDGLRADLDTYNVIHAMVSVEDTAGSRWHRAMPDRLWVGPSFPCYGGRYPSMDPCFEESGGWPDLEWLRRKYEAGRLRAMGELLYVYYGIAPTDERLEPYWALAEELDIPVGVHTGRRPRASLPEGCCPHYDDDLADPALLAPVLERHPNLRIWLMHAPGWDYLDETIALMQAHPTVYAEMSVMNSVMPPEMEAEHLRAIKEAGLIDRIMLGTDNMAIGPILHRIEAIPFLTPKQQRAIYCDNAARFLGLADEVCASP